jgi:hypothetical protein
MTEDPKDTAERVLEQARMNAFDVVSVYLYNSVVLEDVVNLARAVQDLSAKFKDSISIETHEACCDENARQVTEALREAIRRCSEEIADTKKGYSLNSPEWWVVDGIQKRIIAAFDEGE